MLQQLRRRRVVVTGGAGFIGSHLVERLLASEADVVVLDDCRNGSKIDHLKGSPCLTICEGDVRDRDLLSSALAGSDTVFHLAAHVGVENTQRTPLDTLDVEIQGTVSVLSVAVAEGVKRVVFASSSEVYGDCLGPMVEDGPFSPKSAYAAAKLVGEEYCRAFHQVHGLDYTCLRYFNVYGPRQDERFVVPSFVGMAVSGEPLTVHGDGQQTRDFTYIDDAVTMTIMAAVRPEARCSAINVGTGAKTTIDKLADMVAEVISEGQSTGKSYMDYYEYRPRRIEVFNRVADTARRRQLLGCECTVPLMQGLTKYASWYRR